MLSKDINNNFNAYLKSEDGEILATGYASVNIDKQHVTFKSSFVPLYPIGTPMEIVRLFDKKEVHKFTGKVYLSDKKLMRVVSVTDELLSGSENCYCDNVSFVANAQPIIIQEVQEKWQLKLKKKNEVENLDIKIIGMTTKQLVFQNITQQSIEKKAFFKRGYDILMDTEIDIGDEFIINGPFPIEKMKIVISKPYFFGETPCYVCNIVNTSDIEKNQLKDFLWKYNLENNKIF